MNRHKKHDLFNKEILEYINKVKSFRDFDFKVNIIPFPDLLKHYELIGKKYTFLYEQKKQRIEKYLQLIGENWEKGWKGNKNILWTLLFKDSKTESMASVTFWRLTKNSWVAQHLTSTGYPSAVIAMMLTAQLEGMVELYKSFQNWFSIDNPYANKVFGQVVKVIGKEHGYLETVCYMKINLNCIIEKCSKVEIIDCTNNNPNNIFEFIKKNKGASFAISEELDQDDIELKELDDIYREYGLARKRYLKIALNKETNEPIGAIIINRAPFGFNFSLLENRCDLILCKNISSELQKDTCESLLKSAQNIFSNYDPDIPYPLDYMQFTVDEYLLDTICDIGGELIKKYRQSIWLKQGFSTWFNLVEGFMK